MARGFKTGGRKKGTPNKYTRSVRDAFEEAFERLGGVEALIKWGRSEPSEFYHCLVRLLPKQHTIHGGAPIQVQATIDYTQIPERELREYDELFARLDSRARGALAANPSREVPPMAN